MQDVMNEVAKKMNLPDTARLYAYVASYASCETLGADKEAEEIRKEYKYRTIYVRELLEGQDPEKDIKVVLGNTVCHSYYSDESYRKSLISYRLYFINKELTCKEVHHKLFGYYQDVMKVEVENYQEKIIAVE